MDKAVILAQIYQRNTVRRAAGLPLLDVRKEYEKACSVPRLNKWFAFMTSKKDDMERIKAEVLAEYRVSDPTFPSYGPCTLGLVQETYIRFSRYADEHYREEFAEFCAQEP
jgi:hypothetical protein